MLYLFLFVLCFVNCPRSTAHVNRIVYQYIRINSIRIPDWILYDLTSSSVFYTLIYSYTIDCCIDVVLVEMKYKSISFYRKTRCEKRFTSRACMVLLNKRTTHEYVHLTVTGYHTTTWISVILLSKVEYLRTRHCRNEHIYCLNSRGFKLTFQNV